VTCLFLVSCTVRPWKPLYQRSALYGSGEAQSDKHCIRLSSLAEHWKGSPRICFPTLRHLRTQCTTSVWQHGGPSGSSFEPKVGEWPAAERSEDGVLKLRPIRSAQIVNSRKPFPVSEESYAFRGHENPVGTSSMALLLTTTIKGLTRDHILLAVWL
jgi:hypothetical protein